MFHQKIVLSFEIVVVEISLRFHRYVFSGFYGLVCSGSEEHEE